MDMKRRVRYDHTIPFKALILDYDYVFNLPTERACFSLNDREIAVIISGLDVFRWKTRWSGENVDANEIDALVSGITQQLMAVSEECAMPTQFRFVDCVLEYSTDGGENWTPVDGWPENAGTCFNGTDGQDGQDGCSPSVEIDTLENGHTVLNIDSNCDSVIDQTVDFTDLIDSRTANRNACHITHAWVREMITVHLIPFLRAVQTAYDNELSREEGLYNAGTALALTEDWSTDDPLLGDMYDLAIAQASGNLNTYFIPVLSENETMNAIAQYYVDVLPTNWDGYWQREEQDEFDLAIAESAETYAAFYKQLVDDLFTQYRRTHGEMFMKAPYLYDDFCPGNTSWNYTTDFRTGFGGWDTGEGNRSNEHGLRFMIGTINPELHLSANFHMTGLEIVTDYETGWDGNIVRVSVWNGETEHELAPYEPSEGVNSNFWLLDEDVTLVSISQNTNSDHQWYQSVRIVGTGTNPFN